jgi:hypothetical protein
MGFPWKAVLLGVLHVAEPIAANAVPGGAAIDAAVHETIAAKTGTEKEQAIIDSVSAGFNELNLISPDTIVDKDLFNKGLVDAHNAFDEISKALKH